VQVQVSDQMTAGAYGNDGVAVLATPYLIGLLEGASGRAVASALGPGERTVGTHVDVWHESATPVGLHVTARALLRTIEDRRLTFEVEAHDETGRVARGLHERFVVDLDRFLARVEAKRGSPGPRSRSG
jgi:predicted thioesterase